MNDETRVAVSLIINRFKVDVMNEIERVKEDLIKEIWKDARK